jgi:hypothetical protein
VSATACGEARHQYFVGGAPISPRELDQMRSRMWRSALCAQQTQARERLTNEALLRDARRDFDLISRRGDPMKGP